ncbi:unnamed protein product [Medioppia subpectinata]|uniref:Ig-like domain-containing protein n=1 Tax=Medioppia subpectinata TaxID=1979941 RepID=A0A7R9L175_9ACAR|nr:unnamed protein product [Medioppia subpectinata]CAG2112412.1 unnamed protein product [Medioppia subpectinata]
MISVALPCDITPPTLDDQVVLILWYKDEQLAPIYTLDARRGNIEQARTLTSTVLDGRAYFNLHNRPAFLQMDPIRVMDAGDYRCRVDFKKARTVNTVISLKVIEKLIANSGHTTHTTLALTFGLQLANSILHIT